MIPKTLQPRLNLLQKEYVLVQAWKKTASFIRYHNWFSDTLELDRASVNLPKFLAELREQLQSPGGWRNDPLRIVPAPKSQQWTVLESGDWKPVNPVKTKKPVKKDSTGEQLRPLAHVSLTDQVVASALMLCLANRVETLQGDPRNSITDGKSRKKVISYGNRLFCDKIDGKLRHRWGSAKLYRAYFQDYQKFLARPEAVANAHLGVNGNQVFVVHTDLSKFYDRVRPDVLASALDRVRHDDDDSEFFDLARSVLDWKWASNDKNTVGRYAQKADLDDFTRVALPQGLVASGFFANIVLLDFDNRLRRSFEKEIATGIRLVDACRYVDDMRLTVVVDQQAVSKTKDIENAVCAWLKNLLTVRTPDLEISTDKTKIISVGGDSRPLVRQSIRLKRIQAAVSGGFDAQGGEEILDAIQGLVRAQESLSAADKSGWPLTLVPDVRDETVARFAAARFRTTFRSVRPLLNGEEAGESVDSEGVEIETVDRVRAARTQIELDEDARAFALGLIQRWVEDPSNVRLLRIGLDLWPEAGVLQEVLNLLRPFAVRGGRRKTAQRSVAWYCLSEILRAGATETGLVENAETLPFGIDLQSYRETLREEAVRLVELPSTTIPWYLRQQALLFLAAFDPARALVVGKRTGLENRHYWKLIRFLCGGKNRLDNSDFAIHAVLARRAFLDRRRAIGLTLPGLSRSRSREIAARDPSFLVEIIDADKRIFNDLPVRVREDLFGIPQRQSDEWTTLAELVLSANSCGSLRNELSLLRFGIAFLRKWKKLTPPPQVITPAQVQLKLAVGKEIAQVMELKIATSPADPSGSLYLPPGWCEDSNRWRFQTGYLMRFILSGRPDFTRTVRLPNWKENETVYRRAESHWNQRLYGLFNGQPAFGDDWLPMTDWMEGLLMALLRWPGCRVPDGFNWVEHDIEKTITGISTRISELEKDLGRATGTLLLPMVARRPNAETTASRPLRACVVQTVVPTAREIEIAVKCGDPALNSSAIRTKHRNHLSAALAAVKRMLTLRDTHKDADRRLDWLILPELAVHPSDVATHLVPFARAHQAIILTGLTYEQVLPGQPHVNSALWIIPEWSDENGLQIRTRRQGKMHLAPNEEALNGNAKIIQGFRPCQWLVGYPWSNQKDSQPVWLTAAVCYDATDLGLTADLKGRSDVFAIPALNKDVKTFDQMALALHYHMFQLVIVANNGEYGGSNAYWPRKGDWVRQVFHLHGQPQASIAFLEIDDIGAFLDRKNQDPSGTNHWKYPPAG